MGRTELAALLLIASFVCALAALATMVIQPPNTPRATTLLAIAVCILLLVLLYPARFVNLIGAP